ncbi:hypothetical protein LXA39_17580, partial [Erwinia amylovora]|uniref:hypothetical protein n=1 Tax=Erwinia amylovora TaxID=552 RepID=UPI0020BE8EAE
RLLTNPSFSSCRQTSQTSSCKEAKHLAAAGASCCKNLPITGPTGHADLSRAKIGFCSITW